MSRRRGDSWRHFGAPTCCNRWFNRKGGCAYFQCAVRGIEICFSVVGVSPTCRRHFFPPAAILAVVNFFLMLLLWNTHSSLPALTRFASSCSRCAALCVCVCVSLRSGPSVFITHNHPGLPLLIRAALSFLPPWKRPGGVRKVINRAEATVKPLWSGFYNAMFCLDTPSSGIHADLLERAGPT